MTQYGASPISTIDNSAAGEPVIERIAQNLLATLKEVSLAMGDSGNLEVVRPNPALPEQSANYRATLLQEDPELDDESGVPAGLLQWWGNFATIVEVILSENETVPMDTVLNRVCADIQKAYRRDPYRGGLAMDTKIDQPNFAPNEPAARRGTVVVRCRVWFRHIEDDPRRLPGE